MADPPKLSLKERIAALEAQSKADAAPSSGPPPIRPKPGGGATWKPKQVSPPGSPNPPRTSDVNASPQRKTAGVGGMSATDAKESIGKGGSLKERMAALQGRGGFGGPPPPVGPKPVTERPKWKPPPVVAKPESDEDLEVPAPKPDAAVVDEQEKATAPVVVDDTPTEESVDGEVDLEEEERQRRARLAERMSRLGGARVGMAPVYGAKRPSASSTAPSGNDQPEIPVQVSEDPVSVGESKSTSEETPVAVEPETKADEPTETPKVDGSETLAPIAVPAKVVDSEPTEKESMDKNTEPTPTAEELMSEKENSEEPAAEETTAANSPTVAEEMSPSIPTSRMSALLSPKSEDAPDRNQSRSPSAMPVPAAPRRAAPPRKKVVKKVEPDAEVETTEEENVPSKVEDSAPSLVAIPVLPSHENEEPSPVYPHAVASVAVSADHEDEAPKSPLTKDILNPDVAEPVVLEEKVTATPETASSSSMEHTAASEAPIVRKDEAPLVTALPSSHDDPGETTESSGQAEAPPVTTKSGVSNAPGRFLATEPLQVDEEDGEEEADRRARVAARMEKMGGFNPFAAQPTYPTPSTEEEPSTKEVGDTPETPVLRAEPLESDDGQSLSTAPSSEVDKLALQRDTSRTTEPAEMREDSSTSSTIPARKGSVDIPPPTSSEPSSGMEPGETVELTDEEEEVARRKRVAERLARMGGVNPFAAPVPSRGTSTDIEMSSHSTEEEGVETDLQPEFDTDQEEEPEVKTNYSAPSTARSSPEPETVPAARVGSSRANEAPRRTMPPSPPKIEPELLPEEASGYESDEDVPPPPPRRRSPSPFLRGDESTPEALLPVEDVDEDVIKPVPSPRRSMPPPPPRLAPDVPDELEAPVPIPAPRSTRSIPPPTPPGKNSESESEGEVTTMEEQEDEPLPTPPPRQSRPDRRSTGPERSTQPPPTRHVIPANPTTMTERRLQPSLRLEEPEILDEAEGDPIDPGFYSPSPSGSFRISSPPQAANISEHTEEDPEAARRRTIAERMAKLGGIKFGATPMARPPPPRKESLDTPPQVDEPSTLTEEEEEVARKARISAKMAGMGMRYGMGPGMMPPPVPSVKKPALEEEEAPPPPPPRSYAPSRAPPPPQSDSGTSDDGVKVDAEESELEEVTHAEAQEEEAPPVPTRSGQRSSADFKHVLGRPPVPSIPSDVSTRKSSTSRKSSGEHGRAGSFDMSGSNPGIARPQSFVLVDEPTDSEEAPPPPPSRAARPPSSSRTAPSSRPPLDTVDSVALQWEEVSAPSIDFGGQAPDLSLSTFPGEQGVKVPSAPPVDLSPDELMATWGKVGVHLFEVASAAFETAKSGTFVSFGIDAIIREVPEARAGDYSAKPPTYGYLVYSQTGTNVQRRAADIMPGDVITFVEAKFKGHGILGHSLSVGASEPVHGVVCEYDPKKSKLKVFQANSHVGQQSVECVSYRLEDLKTGSIKIYRVLEA